MIKNLKFSVLFLLVCILASNTFVEGQSDEYFYSLRSQSNNNLNGNLSDYKDSSKIKIDNDDPLSSVREIYIKNSETHLWIGVRTTQIESLVGLAILFDSDYDTMYADDGKILYLNNSKIDGYFRGESLLAIQTTQNFLGKVSEITYIDGGKYNLFEYRIPFDTNDPGKDLQIPDPSDSLLGLDIVSIYSNVSLFSLANGESNSLISNAENFSTLILAGPGKFGVPDFSPDVITSSVSPTSNQADSSQIVDYDSQADYAAASTGFEIGYIELILFLPIIVITVIKRKRNSI